MSQPTRTVPQPSDHDRPARSPRPAATVGNVPFTLVLLSAILTFIPWSRPAGIVFLMVLAIPAVVVWVRARKLSDGSRGLTTSTLIIGTGAFILGVALTPGSEATAPSSEHVPPPVQQTVAPPAPATLVPTPAPYVAPGPRTVPVPQPTMQAPPPTTTPAPRVPPTTQEAPAPAPTPETDEPTRAAYYKNCTEAKAAGAAPLYAGDPGYRAALDRDKDGIACE